MAEDAELKKYAKALISTMDKLEQDGRDQGLEALHNMQAIASVMLKREKVRLEKKLGSDHSRVRDLENGIDRNMQIVGDLSDQIQKKNIRVPEIKKDHTLLHGRIKDDAGQSLAGLIVSFTDDKGKELPIPDVETNDSGYFAIDLPANLVEELKDKEISFSVKSPEGKVVFKYNDTFKIEMGQHRLISATVERSKLGGRGGIRKPVVKKKKTTKIKTKKTPGIKRKTSSKKSQTKKKKK